MGGRSGQTFRTGSQRQQQGQNLKTAPNDAFQQQQQQQQQSQQQQDSDSYRDYNGNVSTSGTNNFPQFSTGDVLSFTGVPKDFGGQISVSYTQNGAYVQISGEGVQMDRRINLQDKSVYNEYFRVDRSSRHYGRGAEIFNSQIQTLRNAGFNEVTVTAGGSYGSSMNGYYTWARFGYEPTNNPTMGVSQFNDHLQSKGITNSNVSKFTDIMKTDEGRDWWTLNGRQWSGTFKLQGDGYSINTLNSYMQERAARGTTGRSNRTNRTNR